MKIAYLKIRVGKLVRLFVLADLFLLAGWGLIEPVFAIFILDRIAGATVVTVGAAAAVYWVVKAVVQLPVAISLDKRKGEEDDFVVLIFGMALSAVTAIGFIFIDQVWQLYAMQFLQALAFGIYVPAWAGIFSRHLDDNHEALDWALDNAAISIASSLAAIVGGTLVAWAGFNLVFALIAATSIVAATIVFMTPKLIFRGKRKKPRIGNHRPTPHSAG